MAASGPGEHDLDRTVRSADPCRWLASRFIADRAARADVVALYAFDHELTRAVQVTSNPLLAEIRLAWWREALDEIFAGGPVRAHPAPRALGAALRRHGLPRAPLEAMIDARTEQEPDPVVWADQVGGSATILAARVLDPAADMDAVRAAGRVWGLMMLRRSGRTDIDLTETLAVAARASRRVSPAAFPAIACATLARTAAPSALETRLRLVLAVARGRI